MHNKKPFPLFDRDARATCPVCGNTSYSSAGIHPQCSVRREDDERMRRVRIRVAEGKQFLSVAPNDTSAWKRSCPECDQPQHVGVKACECGYVFANRPPQRNGEATTP